MAVTGFLLRLGVIGYPEINLIETHLDRVNVITTALTNFRSQYFGGFSVFSELRFIENGVFFSPKVNFGMHFSEAEILKNGNLRCRRSYHLTLPVKMSFQ